MPDQHNAYQENNWQQPVWQQPAPQATVPVPPVYYAPYPRKSGKGWIVGIVIVLAVSALIAFGMASCSSMFSSLGGISGGSADDSAFLTGDAVAVITIDGTIQYDGSTSSPEGLKAKLDEAADNAHIKAVVLRVDSGGGVATAGEEMAQYVKDFPKPVVVSSASLNASAAYEISSQADYIFTAKTTAIGSIGTAMTFTDLSGLYEKLGIRIDDVISADSKDSSYGNRPLTDEERAYYQDMIDQINQCFIDNVAQGRHMTDDDVRALATGLTFTGMTAVDNGLADKIGTLEDACDKAAELGGASSSYETVNLEQRSTSLDLLDLLGLLGYASADKEALYQLRELEANGALAQ